MPRYDVRCRTCGDTFEINRPMARADEPAPCPAGHADTVRLMSLVAVTGTATAQAPTGARAGAVAGTGAGAAAGGGCCGGGCCG